MARIVNPDLRRLRITAQPRIRGLCAHRFLAGGSGSLLLAAQARLDPVGLSIAAAYGLHYLHPLDPQSIRCLVSSPVAALGRANCSPLPEPGTGSVSSLADRAAPGCRVAEKTLYPGVSAEHSGVCAPGVPAAGAD